MNDDDRLCEAFGVDAAAAALSDGAGNVAPSDAFADRLESQLRAEFDEATASSPDDAAAAARDTDVPAASSLGGAPVPVAELTEAVTTTARPRRRKIQAAVALAAAAALIAGIVVANRGSTPPGHVDLRTLASATTGSVRIHTVIDTGDGEISTSDGIIDLAHGDIDLTTSALQAGKTDRSRMLLVHGVSYTDPHQFFIRAPEISSSFPSESELQAFLHGRHWVTMGAPPVRTSTTRHTPTTGPALRLQTLGFLGGDVSEILRGLDKAGVRMTEIGTDTIDGVPTTHYRTQYHDSDLFPGSSDSTVPPSPATTFDIWVDDEHRARKVETSRPAEHTDSSDSPASHQTTTFSDFGIGLDVTAPDPSDVVDFKDFFAWLNEHTKNGGLVGGGSISGLSRSASATTSTAP